VSVRRIPKPVLVLAALVAGAVILIVVQLAKGAAGPVSPTLLRPCEPRARQTLRQPAIDTQHRHTLQSRRPKNTRRHVDGHLDRPTLALG